MKVLMCLLLPATLAALPVLAANPEERGEVLYEMYCTQCHGVTGDGNGINVPVMSVQPRNHRDPEEMSTRTDEELFKAIKHGGKSINKSVLMPAWGANLGDDDIQALVRYLRQLCCESGG